MAGKSRCKEPVQQELFRDAGKRGAGRKARRGSGRKARRGCGRGRGRGREGHGARPDFKERHPLHVVMRVVPAVGNLRRRTMYKALREASITAALRERFRIVHVSLQRNHVHMLVEAANKAALGRGMQGFLISAARHINTALGDGRRRRRGSVFADRYHLEVITSPTQARHTLAYVLNNWRKHEEDRAGLPSTWLVDPFSTGILFPDWTELQDQPWMWPLRDTYDPLIVFRARTDRKSTRLNSSH